MITSARSGNGAIVLALVAAAASTCACGRRDTPHPATDRPDQVVLTFSGDPRTAVTVSWRQLPGGAADRVEVRPPAPEPNWTVPAPCTTLDSGDWDAVPNDPVVKRCAADLTGLRADTEYAYRPVALADPGEAERWHRFRTAPAGADATIRFLYLGDVQTDIEAWSARYEEAVRRHPDARFTIQVGDLVDRGARRSDYDDVFGGAPEAFATVPFVPVLGNHEYFFGGVTLFERVFVLSAHSRAFDYGPVRVVVLDSDSDETLAAQADWLGARLDESRAPWKVVVFHHPIWPPRRWFSSDRIREAWMTTIEDHGAHIVLNGHDHSYARTVPLCGGMPAPDGVVYVVSVAGSKFYGQEESPNFARGFENTPTYQVLTASPERLTLSTRTWDGNEVDRFERGR